MEALRNSILSQLNPTDDGVIAVVVLEVVAPNQLQIRQNKPKP
jgi:hypothetical protein